MHDVVEGKMRASYDAPPDESPGEVERPKINFKDVGGMERSRRRSG